MLEINYISYLNILNNISFKVKPAEVLTIIGPNGAGKSSLLNCINGLNKSFKGEVLFNTVALPSLKQIERSKKIAMLSQKTNLAFDMYIEEVIALGLYPYQYALKRRNKIIQGLLQQFELLKYKNRLYSTLSGGEQQRVQMARVFAQLNLENDQGEKILLLDEHVSYLDPYYQHISFSFIQAAAKRYHLTVIAVVHDIALSVEYADKVLLLKDGKVVDFGLVDQVITDYNMRQCFDISLIGDIRTGFKLQL